MTPQSLEDQRLKGKTFDWAMPQDWFDYALRLTSLSPLGHIVWLYDKQAGYCGRPYALDQLGWIILRLLNLKETKCQD